MTTSTLERPGTKTAPDSTATGRSAWTCDNCRAETSGLRKRCTDCGTSRY